MQVAEFWVREFEIDGWRLDVAGEITTPGFWEEFRQRVRAINPEAYIVSEIWTLSPEWLTGDKFDAHMNYPLTEAVVNFAGQSHISESISEHPEFQPQNDYSAQDFGKRLAEILDAYHWETTCVSMNLLDSHDTARMISIVQGDKDSIKLATLFQMTFPGAPSIYYGDEIGLRGTLDYDKTHDDRHARWPMPWNKSEWDLDLMEYFRRTIALRNEFPVLRHGAFRQIFAQEQVFAFSREIEGATPLVVALNVGDDDSEISIDIESTAANCEIVFGSGHAEVVSRKLNLNLPGRDGLVIMLPV